MGVPLSGWSRIAVISREKDFVLSFFLSHAARFTCVVAAGSWASRDVYGNLSCKLLAGSLTISEDCSGARLFSSTAKFTLPGMASDS